MSFSVKALLKATGFAAVLLVLCFALMLGLAGCGKDDKSSGTTGVTGTTSLGQTSTTIGVSADAAALVGKWYCERLKETIEFSSDGKMIWTKNGKQPQTFTYTVQAGMIVFNQPNAPMANNMPFSLEGTSLVTMDPQYGRLSYTKQ